MLSTPATGYVFPPGSLGWLLRLSLGWLLSSLFLMLVCQGSPRQRISFLAHAYVNAWDMQDSNLGGGTPTHQYQRTGLLGGTLQVEATFSRSVRFTDFFADFEGKKRLFCTLDAKKHTMTNIRQISNGSPWTVLLEPPKGDFNWAANFPGGGGSSHLGHQTCRWPLRDVASNVRVKQLLMWTLYPFGRLS